MGRFFLVILLIVLLPLRGWSAEHMAIQMTQGQAVIEMAEGQVSMPADCPMMTSSAFETEKSPHPSKSHAGCQTCQLCMALATQDFSPSRFLAYQRQTPRALISAHFISADLERQVKPPIL